MGSSKEKKAKNKKNKKHRGGGSETPAYEESGRAGMTFATLLNLSFIRIPLRRGQGEAQREETQEARPRERGAK